MPVIASAKQGDTVDLICQRQYGRTADVTEAVLAANPGLAGLGPVLPPNARVLLPDIDTKSSAARLTSLWD
jgi:phage tail protein X